MIHRLRPLALHHANMRIKVGREYRILDLRPHRGIRALIRESLAILFARVDQDEHPQINVSESEADQPNRRSTNSFSGMPTIDL